MDNTVDVENHGRQSTNESRKEIGVSTIYFLYCLITFKILIYTFNSLWCQFFELILRIENIFLYIFRELVHYWLSLQQTQAFMDSNKSMTTKVTANTSGS